MGKKRKNHQDSGNGTIVLMLGLYLILLAFFILLNAISEIAIDKFERASQSIASGFGFQAAQTVIKDDPDEEVINQFYEKIADEIHEVFESYISNSQFDVEADREHMIVRLRPPAFFKKGEWKLDKDQTAFFTDLADLMQEKRVGAVLKLDIFVPEKSELTNPEQMEAVDLAGLRASQFSRALAERGVSSDHLVATMTEQEGKEIILMFKTEILDRTAVIAKARADNMRGRN